MRRRARAAALALALACAAAGCAVGPADRGTDAGAGGAEPTTVAGGAPSAGVSDGASSADRGGGAPSAGDGEGAPAGAGAGSAGEPGGAGTSGEPAGASGGEAVAAPHVEPPPERTTYDVEVEFDPASRRLAGVTIVTARNEADVATSEARLTAYLNAFHADAISERNPVLPEHRKRAYPVGTASLDGRLEPHRASVDGASAAVRRVGAAIVVDLPEPWAPGEWRRIELAWDATLPEVHHRFGFEGDAYWFGNALPNLAVFDGEWRDYAYEPVGDPFYSAVADYRVRVTAPSGYTIVASGDETVAAAAGADRGGASPAGGTASPGGGTASAGGDTASPGGGTLSPGGAIAESGDGFATTIVEAPRARDFAFALGSSHRSVGVATAGGVRVNVFYRDASEARAAAAAEAAAGMIDLLEDWVGAYPYGEMDIFENEMFVTGMEYPGFAFVRGDRLNDPDGVETVVHEVAHQWFYNAIGNDQVREPWLDESFATYMTDVYLLGDRLDATYAERLRTLRQGAVLGDVRSYDSWSAYWNGNYRKGALMLHALRGELGEAGFERFLKMYFERFRDGIATESAFVEAAESAYGESLDEFFERWLP